MDENEVILTTVVKVMNMLRTGRINASTKNFDIVRIIVEDRKKVSKTK